MMTLAASLALFACAEGRASAVDVTLTGANGFSALDASDGAMDGVYRVAGRLVLAPGAVVTCSDTELPKPSITSACAISLVVSGSMEMKAGSAILAENNSGGGNGGNIAITVEGDGLTLEGAAGGMPGAVISSRKNAGTETGGHGGDILIIVGSLCGSGNIDVQAGALITADANGEAGAIGMFSGLEIAVDGTVRSRGMTTTGRGGPITIAGCGGIRTGTASAVSSRGGGPGADRVHLEGSTVEVRGLVESTGPGQERANGRNLCNDPVRPGKPVNSTACVEIWSEGPIRIDAGGGNTGEINADTGFSAGVAGTGWIDILSQHGEIAIAGDADAPYAVHANQGLTNGHGGSIQVDSLFGLVTLSGKAIQANDRTPGGKGGRVTIEATFSSVNFGSASVQAAGATVGGGPQAGGHITVNAFLGSITGEAPGELNAAGGPAPGNGTIVLNFCNTLDYTGAATPALTSFQICVE